MNTTEVKLRRELEGLQRDSKLGLELTVAYEPSKNNPLSGEALGNLIKVYDLDEEKALQTLRHEFLDFCISQAIEPYRRVTNKLIKLLNEEAYQRKEKIVTGLSRLTFEGMRKKDVQKTNQQGARRPNH